PLKLGGEGQGTEQIMDRMLHERRLGFTMAPVVTFVLVMVLVSFEAAQAEVHAGRALMARIIDEPGEGNGDNAVELKMEDFNSTLLASPSSWAIVEFFAHWCPACRNYKPHYEKVARLFSGHNAAHPGIVFMTKVDCALK
ncbi:hypothetical protein KI387_011350, partial [Taxus chinensis]